MTRFASIALGAAFAVLLGTAGAHGDAVEWQAHDDRAIAEPAVDESSEHLVRDGAWAMTVYQLHKVFHPSFLHREAADVNALDEVPDSTWFTNRHARHRLSPAELALGPNGAHAPAAMGSARRALVRKPAGMTAGFVVRDAKGDRYVVKFDSAGYPEVPTGAEMVCTKILHALGWNVPENYLVRLDPSRLVVADDAWTRDGAGTKRALTTADVSQLLAGVAWLPDGRVRAVASRWVPGHAKGGFRTLGRRADDPDDVVPHEDRRELRGLRVVAAWLNYTDARRGRLPRYVRARPGKRRRPRASRPLPARFLERARGGERRLEIAALRPRVLLRSAARALAGRDVRHGAAGMVEGPARPSGARLLRRPTRSSPRNGGRPIRTRSSTRRPRATRSGARSS